MILPQVIAADTAAGGPRWLHGWQIHKDNLPVVSLPPPPHPDDVAPSCRLITGGGRLPWEPGSGAGPGEPHFREVTDDPPLPLLAPE